MRHFIRDHTRDITCSTGELYPMHERGMVIDGMLPPTGNQSRVMRPYIAERLRYHYDPVLATWKVLPSPRETVPATERSRLPAIRGTRVVPG
jgi:hypothetical protein